LVASVLLCIKPIVLPFWCLFAAYCTVSFLRQTITNVWKPIAAMTPVFVQLGLLFLLTGHPTLSPSGSVNISDWFFPRVYQSKEYGAFIGRKTSEAEEGQRKYPELKDKASYMSKNYGVTIKMYLYLLKETLTQGSNYIKHSAESGNANKGVQAYIQLFSIYLNRAFAGAHVIMLALMVWLVASGNKLYEEKTVVLCYLFAALLILPAGLTYNQGDRYILLAQPLWLIGHAGLIALYLDLIGKRIPAKAGMEAQLHGSRMTTLD
jgi:hypothetical protein